MIQFDCPHCRKTLRVKDEFAGQHGKCPHCQNVTTVPLRSAPPPAPAAAPIRASAPTVVFPPAAQAPATVSSASGAPGPAPPTPGVPVAAVYPVVPRRVSGLGIAGLVLGILGAAFCWLPPVGLALAFVGLILAAVGLVLSTTGKKSGLSMPIAGMAVSFVAVIAGAVMLWMYKSTAEYVFERAQDIRYDVEDADRTGP